MKQLSFCLVLCFFVLSGANYAQHITFPLPVKKSVVKQLKDRFIEKEETNWVKKNQAGVDLSEVAFVNWNSGGTNSFSGLAEVKIERNYADVQTKWRNRFVGRYGINSQEGREIRKTDDQLEVTSDFGYRRDTISNWYYSAKFRFASQFTNGYKYPDNKTPISQFMAPGYVFLGIGSEYGKRIDNLSVYASPLTYKSTIVLDQVLANTGSFGVEPAVRDADGNIIKEGENFNSELGILLQSIWKARLMENINFTNSINLYTDYLNSFGNIDVDWELNLNFKVNSFVLAKLGSHLRYDNDIKITETNVDGDEMVMGARVQWKQQLGIGVIVDF
ncbi:DUF3078 domain-containing protein [Leeuwenhoekiella parthenopeia]|uniref:DUF3078 domain-containing protein n=1 Tax=Leeuwenhoekiella parthenopeia TaxID=2890320 RepID=A0ABS8GUC6_9FLAO|nr:DUF3078 domain-containing protein [Leeuwenhoekiella parthenopeia]MCC4212812.1 DUF3078 domain-containing protein [Leeuwenhoekiella parthenopeia]